MAPQTPNKATYPEPNPLIPDVAAAQQLLAATKGRQALYHYLRELKDDQGFGDIRKDVAEEIARYTWKRVHRLDGFSPEELRHINTELDRINELRMKAYQFFK